MKRHCMTCLLLVVVAIALMVPANAFSKEPVKIGILVPLSGLMAQSGIEMRAGIEMAGKEKGTILDRPIKFVVEDTQGQAAVGVSKAERLVYKDGCVALIGVMSSAVALAIGKNINRLKVPFVATQPVSRQLYSLNPWTFRCGQLVTDQSARGVVSAIAANPDLSKRKYYVLVLDYAYGHDAASDFIAAAKKKGITIVNENYDKAPVQTTDWSTYLTKIKASGANGIFLAIFTNAYSDFSRQMKDFGVNAEIISPAAPGPTDLEKSGQAGAGIISVTNWSWDVHNPASDAWAKKFWDAYKIIPSNAAACSYVAAELLFKAIDKAGNTNVDKIAKALEGSSTNEGPLGLVKIDAKDHTHRMDGYLTETAVAPPNPYGAKMYIKVLKHISAKELGPTE